MTNEEKNLEIVKRQEERILFAHCDNDDAWNLGSLIVDEARKAGKAVAVEIHINGYHLFRYGFNGTNGYNDW